MSSSLNLSELEKSDLDHLSKHMNICEAAERYEDMRVIAKCIVQKNPALTTSQRNHLSVAYKNVVGCRRSSWRILCSQLADNNTEDLTLISSYKSLIENELEEYCNEIIDMLINKIIPIAEKIEDDREPEVFYKKMCGDYYRYLAEIRPNKNNEETVFYKAATEIANKHLPNTHPTRLGLALNYSVSEYEIAKDPASACQMAKTAFDEAINCLDSLDDINYKDSTLIMQLLRDNLTLWSSENEGDEEPKDLSPSEVEKTESAQKTQEVDEVVSDNGDDKAKKMED